MKYRKSGFISLILVAFALGSTARAAVPEIINVQGRVVKNGVNFDGSGDFKFVLVDGTGAVLWSHNGNSSGTNGEPNGFVSLAVTNGLYSVGLGDSSSPHFMVPISPGIFVDNSEVDLRVWFRDQANAFEQLSPDQRITSVGFAMVAQEVLNPGITTIFVGPVEGGSVEQNGDALVAALNGITDNSSSKPYLVKLEPGTFDLGVNGHIPLKSHVHIEGSGRDLTRIVGRGIYVIGKTTETQAVDNCAFRSLKVVNAGGLNGFRTASGQEVFALHVNVEVVDGVSPAGFSSNGGRFDLTDVAIDLEADLGNDAFGVILTNSATADLFGISIEVSGDNTVNRIFGIWINDASIFVDQVEAVAMGTKSVGIEVVNNGTATIRNSRMVGDMNSINNTANVVGINSQFEGPLGGSAFSVPQLYR